MLEKNTFFALIMVICFVSTVRPRSLVNVKKVIPTIHIDLKYATEDNFVHARVYDFDTCYLLDNVCDVLKKVQEDLAPLGLGLKVFDGFRTREAQIKFWNICPDERYVSNPYKELGRHTRGTTVDVTLVDLKTGQELEMPTPFDDFTEKAATYYAGATSAAIKNRTILQQAMGKHGFQVCRTEWWHFDYQGWQNCEPLNVAPKNQDRIELN